MMNFIYVWWFSVLLLTSKMLVNIWILCRLILFKSINDKLFACQWWILYTFDGFRYCYWQAKCLSVTFFYLLDQLFFSHWQAKCLSMGLISVGFVILFPWLTSKMLVSNYFMINKQTFFFSFLLGFFLLVKVLVKLYDF